MRWFLPVTSGISTGHSFLFGGCALGAAISALEGSTGRPIIWATAQYLSFARPPSVMDIDVTVASEGRQTTQARAVGTVGNTEILTVNAALGDRELPASGQWPTMPKVPAPDHHLLEDLEPLAEILDDGQRLVLGLRHRADGRDRVEHALDGARCQ